jgi:hypothetical protein
MKNPTVMVVALAPMFLLCALPRWRPDRQTPISGEICRLESEMNRAIITHDERFLEEHPADEYQHTNYIGGKTDKKAALAFFASPDFSLTKASIDSCNVRVYKDIAIATGINNWTEARYGNTETPTDAGIAVLVSDIFGTDRRPVLSKLDRPAMVIGSG